jgi:hypothetical protein
VKRKASATLAVALLLAACRAKPMDEETKAYASSIVFSNVRLSAEENMAHQTVHYLRIDVQNRGPRQVKHLEVILYFRNTLGQVALYERAMAISPRLRPLAPGETRAFKQGFDPPADWNRTSPNIGISYLAIE